MIASVPLDKRLSLTGSPVKLSGFQSSPVSVLETAHIEVLVRDFGHFDPHELLQFVPLGGLYLRSVRATVLTEGKGLKILST